MRLPSQCLAYLSLYPHVNTSPLANRGIEHNARHHLMELMAFAETALNVPQSSAVCSLPHATSVMICCARNSAAIRVGRLRSLVSPCPSSPYAFYSGRNVSQLASPAATDEEDDILCGRMQRLLPVRSCRRRRARRSRWAADCLQPCEEF